MPPSRSTAAFGSLLASQELFRADGLSISANGDTVSASVVNQVLGPVNNGSGPSNLGPGLIDVSAIGQGLLIVNVANAPAGTSPTLNFQLMVQDAYGHYAAVTVQTGGIFGSTPITAAGTYAAALSSAVIAAYTAKLAWTAGGTSPSFTGVSINVYGR